MKLVHIVGARPQFIKLAAVAWFNRRRPVEPEVHPYGDGRAGARIAKLIAASLS